MFSEMAYFPVGIEGLFKPAEKYSEYDQLANQILYYLLKPLSPHPDLKYRNRLNLHVIKKLSTPYNPSQPELMIYSSKGRTDHTYSLPEFHPRVDEDAYTKALSAELEKCIKHHLQSEQKAMTPPSRDTASTAALHEPTPKLSSV